MIRRKVDVQKLSAQVGRMLDRMKAFKYFDCRIEADGIAAWHEKAEVIDEENRFNGWYLLTASLSSRQAEKGTVFSHYHSLLEVERRPSKRPNPVWKCAPSTIGGTTGSEITYASVSWPAGSAPGSETSGRRWGKAGGGCLRH